MSTALTKPAVKSLGVTAPLISILVIVAGMLGVDISADVAGVPETIASTIDNVVILSGIVVGIYGRLRASTLISGIFK
jgi:hypothetical protein